MAAIGIYASHEQIAPSVLLTAMAPLDDGHRVPDADGAVSVPLDPYGHRWFRVRRDGQRLSP